MTEAALALQAELLPERSFRTYHLGQWVETTSGWLPDGVWDSAPVSPAALENSEIVIAVEGTYKRTLAIVGCTLGGEVFHCYAGDVVTDEQVERALTIACERWDVLEVVHPKRIRTRLFAELARQGMPLRAWDASADNEAASANELYRSVVEGRVPHDHHPLLAEHVAALAVRVAVDGSIRLVRPESGAACDAALAMRAAWYRAVQLGAGGGSGLAIY